VDDSHGTRPGSGARRGESPGEILPGAPRVEALDALLRDVDGLRLVLDTDLTVAAAAAEAGALDVAADVVEGDRAELARFEQRALRRLSGRGPERRLRLVPLVAAASVALLALGTTAHQEQPVPAGLARADAARSWSQLAGLVDRAAPLEQVRGAAERLHADVRALLALAPGSPDSARDALSLLRSERAALLGLPEPRHVRDLLAEVDALTARLRVLLQLVPGEAGGDVAGTVSVGDVAGDAPGTGGEAAAPTGDEAAAAGPVAVSPQPADGLPRPAAGSPQPAAASPQPARASAPTGAPSPRAAGPSAATRRTTARPSSGTPGGAVLPPAPARPSPGLPPVTTGTSGGLPTAPLDGPADGDATG